jgi:hypothetical protein
MHGTLRGELEYDVQSDCYRFSADERYSYIGTFAEMF